MASEYRTMSKGPVCAFLDELSRDKDAVARLESLVKDLEGLGKQYDGIVGVFDKHLFQSLKKDQRKKITDYLKKCWFDPMNGWWGHLQPVAPVFGAAVVQAIKASLGRDGKKKSAKPKSALPIDSYWMAVGDRLEAAVMRSRHQVTLIIMTPRPPTFVKMGGIGCGKTTVWTIAQEGVPAEKRKTSTYQLDSSGRHRTAK